MYAGCCFTRPIWPEQSKDLAWFDRKAEILHGREAFVLLAEVRDCNHVLFAQLFPVCRLLSGQACSPTPFKSSMICTDSCQI